MKTKIIAALAILLMMVAFTDCKKKKNEETKVDPRVPPSLAFKTGTLYTSSDATLTTNMTVTVGIDAAIMEDPLKSFNVSYAYDGAATTTTFYNYNMVGVETSNYSKDIAITTRNVTGTEKWTFSVIDKDGNITQKSLNFLVQ